MTVSELISKKYNSKESQREYRKRNPKKVREYKKRYYGKTSNSENAHQRWTDEEIRMVMEHKITDYELALKIGRSMESIQGIRCRMNRRKKDGRTN